VEVIGSEKYLLAVTNLQLVHFQDVNKLRRHRLSPLCFGFGSVMFGRSL
jgi:hypothetical protein